MKADAPTRQVDIDMYNSNKFYIDGAWVEPISARSIEVINPATERSVASVAMGSADDVDAAVEVARKAFPAYSKMGTQERASLLARIVEIFEARLPEIAKVISLEMGAPIAFATRIQASMALEHFRAARKVLLEYSFEQQREGFVLMREPIGVCGLITAWNWPLSLVTSKLAYALAAGCTVVVKPSELAPLSTLLLAEIIDEAGLPAGVFNLVNGDGEGVGRRIAEHPDIDLVSFTGSTRAGVLIAKAAADNIKRVHQELGGKSANIILPDADLQSAVSMGARRVFANSGQSCQAPTRMFVHADQYQEAVAIARKTAEQLVVGDPEADETEMGPLISAAQYQRVQDYITIGENEGATLAAGGHGKPEGLITGYYARPTVFSDVSNDMTVAQEEIFGPVLCMIPYRTAEDAVRMANDSIYGLAAYIQTADPQAARGMAADLRAGRVYINTVEQNTEAPFGGYKMSGNGREQGEFGFEEYLEAKAVIGTSSGNHPN